MFRYLQVKCYSFTRRYKWNGEVKVVRLKVPLRSPPPPPGLHRDVVEAVVADVVDPAPVAALVDGVGDVLVGVEVVNSHGRLTLPGRLWSGGRLAGDVWT